MKSIKKYLLSLFCLSSIAGSGLVGVWESSQGLSRLEFTEDGRFIIGPDQGSYRFLSDKELELTVRGDSIEFTFEIVDGALSWGTNFTDPQIYRKI